MAARARLHVAGADVVAHSLGSAHPQLASKASLGVSSAALAKRSAAAAIAPRAAAARAASSTTFAMSSLEFAGPLPARDAG